MTEIRKTTILVIIDHYLPGYRTSGPVRTTSNMVAWLGEKFLFKIVTLDHDKGDSQAYSGIQKAVWNGVGNSFVRYLSPREEGLWGMRRILSETPFDAIYLNSIFASLVIKILILSRVGQIPHRHIILAPRGHLHPGALSLKPTKKRLFLWLARRIGLYNNLIWHASSPDEMTDIMREFGSKTKAEIKIIPNLPTSEQEIIPHRQQLKRPGEGRLVFLSRISRKKNLDFALSLLSSLTGQIQFDIYGPIEDVNYWQECLALIYKLPSNVVVEYKGIVPFDRVTEVFSKYNLFLLPTLGENFGHAILESLRAGCPVLISDQTPWKDLEAHGAGWSLPLSQTEPFREIIRSIVAMEASAFERMAGQAKIYGKQYEATPLVESMEKLFMQATGGS